MKTFFFCQIYKTKSSTFVIEYKNSYTIYGFQNNRLTSRLKLIHELNIKRKKDISWVKKKDF